MESRQDDPALAGIGKLLDVLPMPAFISNQEHEILAHNDCFRADFGRGLSVLGQRCHEAIHCDPVPCHRRGEPCPLRSCLESATPTRAVHVHPTPRGPLRQHITAFSLWSGPGRTRWGLIVLHPSVASVMETTRGWPIGRSRAFVRVITLVRTAAIIDSPVLLLGEPGTGKELLARTIHRLSARRLRPFVQLGPSDLSELAMWDGVAGVDRSQQSIPPTWTRLLAELLGGGTLYLREVGDLSSRSQATLRALVVGWVSGVDAPLGNRSGRLRLVCGSEMDLPAAVAEGRFRRDLYYRIGALSIRVPPLRERMEDLPELVAALLEELGASAVDSLDADTLTVLEGLDYPGNLDQLRRILRDACVGLPLSEP